MNLNEYQRLAQRTSATVGIDKVKNGCLGLIGESGEIVDILKKYMFQSGENPPFPKEKFINEMGDVLWYCAEVTSGFSLEMKHVFGVVSGYFQKTSAYSLEEAVISLSYSSSWVYERCFSNGAVIDMDAVIDALRDVYGLLLDMCSNVGTSIHEVSETNIEKLKKRYPDGFDPERSIHRPEYEQQEQKNVSESASGFLFEKRNKTV